MYTIQDSGNPAQVVVTDLTGTLLGKITMVVDGKQVRNQDFEAVACDDKKVYVGDIGSGASPQYIYSFDYPIEPTAKVFPHWQRFPADYNFEGLAVFNGHILMASKDWDGADQFIVELVDGVLVKKFRLQVPQALGDISISPDGKTILVTQDDSNIFWECNWEGACEPIELQVEGDHEAVTYLSNNAFLFTSEDGEEIYRAEYKKIEDVKPTDPPAPQTGKWFIPRPMSSWQVMDEDDGDYVAQYKAGTELVTIEGIQKDYAGLAKDVAALKAKGARVICYQSLSYEPWRHDIKNFPAAAKGKKMKGWDEWWTDTRATSPANPFWENRYKELAKAGCDCVEDDNEVDPQDNVSGFPMTRADAEAASKKRADMAHAVGMCHIAKNNPSISDIKSKYSDGVVIEEAAKYNERAAYLPWKNAGKYGAMVEYNSSGCKPYEGFSVQYHPNGDYFDGLNFKVCDLK
jgi:hypothetical protein